jgi:hypothetical protein
MTGDSARAQALAALAPLLPLAEQPPVLAQAPPTSTDDYTCVLALAALAPHLPSDLLPLALAATPKSSLQTKTAILERGRSALQRDGNAAFVDLLREIFTGTERSFCFELIAAVAPFIAETGGVRDIDEFSSLLLTCINGGHSICWLNDDQPWVDGARVAFAQLSSTIYPWRITGLINPLFTSSDKPHCND